MQLLFFYTREVQRYLVGMPKKKKPVAGCVLGPMLETEVVN